MVDDSARSSRGGPSDAGLHPRVGGLVTIGTMEGELEGSLLHGRKRFLLRDRLTGRRVPCCFGDAVSREEIKNLFGKRIAVTGEIRSRRSGERASIDVSSVYVFPREEDLPSPDEVRGLLGNAE